MRSAIVPLGVLEVAHGVEAVHHLVTVVALIVDLVATTVAVALRGDAARVAPVDAGITKRTRP
jgi:hypothetical protein